MDCTALELDAVKFAKTAVTYDQNAKYNEAVFYYKVGRVQFEQVNNCYKLAFSFSYILKLKMNSTLCVHVSMNL